MILRKAILAAAFMCAMGQLPVFAQAQGKFTGDQYKKALWMATRFYGGQRSGEGPNWLIMEHTNPAYRTSYTNDVDGSRDISGGWFDCGDHILYGQTFFFSAYMLALVYESFPTGFHDLYRGNYSDYMSTTPGKWTINDGEPNGIPDLLEELKYATDWIMKAVPDANTFIFQVGDRRSHDVPWATAGYQSANYQTGANWNGGSPRPVYKNPNDKVMPSFAAAALAVMSRIYRKYDADYADICLVHAKYAYDYANGRSGSVGSSGGSQYQAHKDPATVFVTAASEMYLTTGDNTYWNAIAKNEVKTHNHVFDYSNSHDLAAYAAVRASGKAGNTADRTHYLSIMLNEFITKYLQNVGGSAETGISNLGGGWGEMRYLANVAFIAALYSSAAGTNQYDEFIYRQIDFILGDNNAKRSFLAGFTENPAGFTGTMRGVSRPHHRNVFLRDFDNWNDYNSQKGQLQIPERNRYFGYMAGGRRNSNSFNDNDDDFTATEGGIDYQAGFLGALAYIVSKSSAAADTSKFTGNIPPPQIPASIRVSRSNNPADTTSYIDTLFINTVDENTGTLYAHIFSDSGAHISSGIICDDITWTINADVNISIQPGRGCSAPIEPIAAITPKIENISISYSLASQQKYINTLIPVIYTTSVSHKTAPAKQGFAMNIRRGAVVFTAAESKSIKDISIYNIAGKKVFGQKASGPTSQIRWKTAASPRGMYLARITQNDGAVVQRNILLR